jgi:hypothetical protein
MTTTTYSKTTKWRLRVRNGHHEKITSLWLYPELDCSACVDDVYGEDGAAQLEYYCERIQEWHPEWWTADAVPILWSVIGGDDGFGREAAPCLANAQFVSDEYPFEHCLTFYHTPVNLKPVNDALRLLSSFLAWPCVTQSNWDFPARVNASRILSSSQHKFDPIDYSADHVFVLDLGWRTDLARARHLFPCRNNVSRAKTGLTTRDVRLAHLKHNLRLVEHRTDEFS